MGLAELGCESKDECLRRNGQMATMSRKLRIVCFNSQMRTHFEFRSTEFPAYPEEEVINPGRFGKRLAEFLAAELPWAGFEIANVSAEDWGWRIDLNHDAFPLWIGCGNYEEHEDGFLCFIEPSKPYVRRFLRRISTTSIVDRLAATLDDIVRGSDKALQLRWWTEAEAGGG